MNNKERTLARENIVKILYQNNISQNDIPTIISTFIEKRKFDYVYFKDVLKLLNANMDKIDNFIEKKPECSTICFKTTDKEEILSKSRGKVVVDIFNNIIYCSRRSERKFFTRSKSSELR